MKKHINKIILVLLMAALVFSIFTACNNGSNGENGKSAYEIWLDEGHSGSEVDFLDWLKGTAGNDGKDGEQGEKGDEGKDGDIGLSAYEIYIKYHPEYEGDEEQWINDLANGNLARFTVYFNSLGGSTINEITNLTKDSYIDEPAIPILEGSTFLGWYKEKKCINEWDFETDRVNANITLYAKWEIEYTAGLLYTPINGGVAYEVSVGGALENGNTDIVIPSVYDDLPITKIADYGFGHLLDKGNPLVKNITSITIPDSVTDIGEHAFSFCKKLMDVMLPENLESIGAWAFAECKILNDVIIPESVTFIGDGAFNGCEGLINMEIPGGVSIISDSMFGQCFSLKNVVISHGVTEIGYRVFGQCYSLENISIPDSVTSIGISAFFYCEKLESITLPSGITSMGYGVFSWCYRLTSINTTDNPKPMENGLYVIDEDGKTTKDSGIAVIVKLGDIVTLTSVLQNTQSLTVPHGVTHLGITSFSECSKLTNVILPDSLTYIGEGAFNECGALTSIKIPDGVTQINQYTFADCVKLSDVTLSNTLTIIGMAAFIDCKALKNIVIPDSVTQIRSSAFQDSGLENITIPDSVTFIQQHAFTDCDNLKSITIPDNTSVGSYLFVSADKVTVYVAKNGKILRTNANWNYYGQPVVWDCTIKLDNINPLTGKGQPYVFSFEKSSDSFSNPSTVNAPYRTDYSFEGWYTLAAPNVLISAGDIINATNDTYYAKWVPIIFDVSYGISVDTLDGIGGTVVGDMHQRVKIGENAAPVEAIPAEGFEFIGWDIAYDGDFYFYHYDNYLFEYTPAQRHDTNVNRHIYASAVFVKADEVCFAGGTGTEASPYLIETYSQLLKMRRYPTAYYKLIADIDMDGISYTPMFTQWGAFNGVFDGNGKTISNLSVNLAYHNFPSLFGFIGENGVVKELTMTEVDITVPSRVALLGATLTTGVSTDISGGISASGRAVSAGAVAGVCLGKLSDINTSGTIRANGLDYDGVTIGGLTGMGGEIEIENCHADIKIIIDDILVSNHLDSIVVGGLIGSAFGNLNNCSASGSITLTNGGNYQYIGRYLGGLVGQYYYYAHNDKPATIEISDCNTDVEIICDSNSVTGGLIASISKNYYNKNYPVFTITDCSSTGDIDSYYRIGGFIGEFYVGEGSKIVNCYATGDIISRDGDDTGLGNDNNARNSHDQAGGFISRTQITGGIGTGGVISREKIEIKNCYATGDVKAKYGAAGFVNYAFSTSIFNCYATGDVLSELGVAGGFASMLGGVDTKSMATISNCYATGEVTLLDHRWSYSAAGFAVDVRYGELYRCYSTGNAVSQNCGAGFVETLMRSTASECFATGDATGSCAAGFIYDSLYSQISDCYALGDVYMLGTVDWWRDVGGFVGSADYSQLSNCYSGGKIFAGDDMDEKWLRLGGFAGELRNSTAENCHWVYYSDGATEKSVGDTNMNLDSIAIVKHNDISDLFNLADTLNGERQDIIWANVIGRPPQLLFIL